MASRIVKGGPGLSAYLDAAKAPDTLYGDIQKHVLAEASRPSGRRWDVLHPSEMVKTNWCHRAATLRLLSGPPKRATTFVRENIFAEGHNTHAKWQRWLAEMGRLAGDWYCRCCKQTYWDDERPATCHLCSAPGSCIDYAEVPLNADPLRISGKADGYCPDDGCLIEIKTMGLGGLRFENPGFLARYEVDTDRGTLVDLQRLWRDVKRPLPAAYRQGQLYMYIARHFEDLPVESMLYIYDFKANQESKSFSCAYDETVSEPVIDAAALIVDCASAGTSPACNISKAFGCNECRTYEGAA